MKVKEGKIGQRRMGIGVPCSDSSFRIRNSFPQLLKVLAGDSREHFSFQRIVLGLRELFSSLSQTY